MHRNRLTDQAYPCRRHRRVPLLFFLYRDIKTTSVVDTILSLTLEELPSNACGYQIVALFPPLLCFCLLLSDCFFRVFGQALLLCHGDTAPPTNRQSIGPSGARGIGREKGRV